jgi:hypothetical protein
MRVSMYGLSEAADADADAAMVHLEGVAEECRKPRELRRIKLAKIGSKERMESLEEAGL